MYILGYKDDFDTVTDAYFNLLEFLDTFILYRRCFSFIFAYSGAFVSIFARRAYLTFKSFFTKKSLRVLETAELIENFL
jgi:hypothetical protein